MQDEEFRINIFVLLLFVHIFILTVNSAWMEVLLNIFFISGLYFCNCELIGDEK